MAQIISAYDAAPIDFEPMGGVASDGFTTAQGQTFKSNPVLRTKITSAKFYIKRLGTLTGNVDAALYTVKLATNGTSLIVDTLLSTSSAKAASSISTTASYVEFLFTNGAIMQPNTTYAIVVRYTTKPGAGNVIYVGYMPSGTDPGTSVFIDAGGPGFYGTGDVPYYVYGTPDYLVAINSPSHGHETSFLVPSITPIVGYSGGFGAGVWGGAMGGAIRPISQDYLVQISSASHGHSSTINRPVQVHKVVVSNIAHTLVGTPPQVKYTINLAVNSAVHSLLSSRPELIDERVVPVNNSSMGITSPTLTLGQSINLQVNSSVHSTTNSGLVPTQNKTLVVRSAQHVTSSTITKLVQNYLLNPSSSTHGSYSDTPTVHQSMLLAVNSAVHGTTSDVLDIIEFTLLHQPSPSSSSVSSPTLELIQAHELLIGENYIGLSSDTIKVFNWADYNKHFGNYASDSVNTGAFEQEHIESSQIGVPAIDNTGTFKVSSIERGTYAGKDRY